MTPTFANPWAFLLLLMLPAFVWWWQKRQRSALAFPAIQTCIDLPCRRARSAERGGVTLRAVGLLFVAVALAGPRWPDEGSRIPTEGISIAFVLDASHSMAQEDFRWGEQVLTRFDGVSRVFRLMVEGGTGLHGETFPGRPQDLISLVVFATRPDTACPLTLDHAALLTILDKEEPRTLITEATTNPGDGLAWLLYALQKAPTRRKVVILLTDGESNVPPPALKPRQAAQLAGNLHIPIYAINASPADAEGNAAASDALRGKQILDDIAKLTQGRSFRASDGPALTEALAQIDRLERDEIRSFQYRRYDEAYPWFSLAGLVCWLLVVGLEATWWRRVP